MPDVTLHSGQTSLECYIPLYSKRAGGFWLERPDTGAPLGGKVALRVTLHIPAGTWAALEPAAIDIAGEVCGVSHSSTDVTETDVGEVAP